jgi:dephospho-CoA kinase
MAFGNDYLADDGALDRTRMRKLVFADTSARQRLEGILHPLIREQARARLLQLQDAPYIILVVPLLSTSPAFQQLVQRILVVDCAETAQIARVIDRSRMAEAEVRAIIASQTPRTERLRLADDIIHNDAGLDSLATQVAVLHGRYQQNSN